MAIRLVYMLCCMILLSACNTPGSTKKTEDFDAFVNHYIANLRWSRFNEAARLHVNREGEQAAVDLARLKPIRITGHKMQEKILSPTFDTASVVFSLSYYDDTVGMLREEEVRLELWRNEDSGRWLIESEFPEFK